MPNLLKQFKLNLDSSFFRLVLNSFKTLALIPLLIFASQIIDPLRGMDFSDEGHYLISADPNEKSDAWGWPYGWNLQIIFKLLGFSISNFRIFGFVAIILATIIFAKNFSSVMKVVLVVHLPVKMEGFILLILIVSSLFYYQGFLRTPSYNWLNLIAILLGFSGLFRLHVLLYQDNVNSRSLLYPLILMSVGEFIALPSKPTTSLGLFLWQFFLLIIFKKYKLGIILSIFQTFLLLVFVNLAVLSNFWPGGILRQVEQVLHMPPFASYHTLIGATYDLVFTPINVINSLLSSEIFVVAFVIILLNFFVGKKDNARKTLIKHSFIARLCIYIVGILTFIAYGLVPNLTDKEIQWLENPVIALTINTILVLEVIYFLLGIQVTNPGLPIVGFLKSKIDTWLIVGTLFLGSVLFGFGSSGGISSKMSLAPIFGVAVLVFIILKLDQEMKKKYFELFALAIVLVLMLITVYHGSVNAPYRSAPMSSMTSEVLIGNHNSKILLSKNDARTIKHLRESAAGMGFNQNTSLVSAVYPSGIGYGYALGGRQSPTVTFVWFGYENSLKQAAYLLSKSEERFDFERSWLLLSPQNIYGDDLGSLKEFLELLESYTKKGFPRSYTLVYSSATHQLWKPIF